MIFCHCNLLNLAQISLFSISTVFSKEWEFEKNLFFKISLLFIILILLFFKKNIQGIIIFINK